MGLLNLVCLSTEETCNPTDYAISERYTKEYKKEDTERIETTICGNTTSNCSIHENYLKCAQESRTETADKITNGGDNGCDNGSYFYNLSLLSLRLYIIQSSKLERSRP